VYVNEPSLLLQLPDPCLLTVLQYCADDHCSLFSAARAHSRLHQAAVLALTSIKAVVVEQHIDSLMLYLGKHGQQIESVDLTDEAHTVILRQLPHDRLQKLSSLKLRDMWLQLLPGEEGTRGFGCPGIVAGLHLKQLHLDSVLLDEQGLQAALLSLPMLEQFSYREDVDVESVFSHEVVQVLQQLTYLQLPCILKGPDSLQQLQGLTRLQELRLRLLCDWQSHHTVTASTLSGLQQLTHIELKARASHTCELEPGALAVKTQLHHLELVKLRIAGGSAGVLLLMSHLQQMQQLTFLSLRDSLESTAPAATYSALTVSSKLQHVDVSDCVLPAGVWQHMFPDGRQLPHLQVLGVGRMDSSVTGTAAAPDMSSLVSCCRGLQSLEMEMAFGAESLAALTGLSSLLKLDMWVDYPPSEGLKVVCQLTGLRELHLAFSSTADGFLLQLTQLRQLTRLHYSGVVEDEDDSQDFIDKWYNAVVGTCCTHPMTYTCCKLQAYIWQSCRLVGPSGTINLSEFIETQPIFPKQCQWNWINC
jgi:hypothetical protein